MKSLKNKWLLAVICSAITVGSAVAAEKKEEKSKAYIEKKENMLLGDKKVAERTRPVGKIYVAGDDVPAAKVPAAPVATGPRSGEDVYNTKCAACHGSGLLNAPKYGTSQWTDLEASKGLDGLVATAISGINAMPPKGTCSDCSDDEIKGAIEYMISSAK
ncbi:cytochrome c5 family protein [Pleionea sp. CnH1-48]|uniref:c-type cytochrome n=1 Tax=Pleionea sp. CnH1-48 TaxID=2954494 RepID=UPI0020978684|nr:c-type cytochrome [Pleionea sp. CnH1-48]MCO7227360.1 c-type cytochrome [Pleionea sp. CnH1-48]